MAAEPAPAIPPRAVMRRTAMLKGAGVAALTVAIALAVGALDLDGETFRGAPENFARFLADGVPPDFGGAGDMLHALWVTFAMALLASAASTAVAFVLAPLGARSTAPARWIHQLVGVLMAALRSVPEIVLLLLFIATFGPEPVAVAFAVAFHSLGILVKLWSEAVEQVDAGPVDALRLAGAGRTAVYLHAVLPTVAPTFVGLALYRLDVNFRTVLVLGAAAGGFGLGAQIREAQALLDYPTIAALVVVITAAVVALDQLSAGLRRLLA
jgi:phosphonate transport system permease protein